MGWPGRLRHPALGPDPGQPKGADACQQAPTIDVLKDPNHVRIVQRWTKVDGERQAVTKQQAVRPWWKTDPSGQVVMSVKFGAKPGSIGKTRKVA